jgi:hypothetical protein
MGGFGVLAAQVPGQQAGPGAGQQHPDLGLVGGVVQHDDHAATHQQFPVQPGALRLVMRDVALPRS